LGVDSSNCHPREKPVAKEEEELPYRIRTTQYDREEKIMIKVKVQ